MIRNFTATIGPRTSHRLSMKSALVRLFGFPATLIHGDTLVLDRWNWLSKNLPSVQFGSRKLLDVGCGSGAFTIGLGLRGYVALGLSWDEGNQASAQERAKLCGASLAEFNVLDVRLLHQHTDLFGEFDVAVCCETIEHIIDDRKLVTDISRCLKPGGVLLLTSPSIKFRPITRACEGPYLPIEDGRHVRKGYSPEILQEICAAANVKVLDVSYCGGFLSQKVTGFMRVCSRIHPIFGWLVSLPFRPFIPLVDPLVTRLFNWPGYCVALRAEKL
jgi:SAM-dependent methyltransferase